MTDLPTPPEAGDSSLDAYIREHRAAYTEDALRAAAISAGHSPEAVEAALGATRGGAAPRGPGVAIRRVFIAYLAVWLILDTLMLINPANNRSGVLGDMRGIGILFLSISLGVAFLASLAWIASRRGFVALVGIILVLWGLGSINAILPAALAIGGGSVLVILTMRGRQARSATSASSPTAELLMSMPLLILLVVGGICVASGLPVPRPV
jgi:hypothetical protein